MSETIRAKEFIVVDDSGRERAKFGAYGDVVTLNIDAGRSSSISLAVNHGEDSPCFELRSGDRTIRLVIDGHRAQIKIVDHTNPVASCGLTIDDAGAWVYAEATPEIGVRMLTNRGGVGSSVWLAERRTEDGEQVVRTRYIHPEAKEDSTGGWWASGSDG